MSDAPPSDVSGSPVENVPVDLSGSPVDVSGSRPVVESEEAPHAAQIVGAATAAALPLIATLLGVVSPPIGFLMAIAGPAVVSGLFRATETVVEQQQQQELEQEQQEKQEQQEEAPSKQE